MVSVDDLEQFPIFSGLDHTLLTNIAEICSTHTYQAEEVCVAEGAVAQNFYVGIPLTGLATICSIGKCGGLPKNLDGA